MFGYRKRKISNDSICEQLDIVPTDDKMRMKSFDMLYQNVLRILIVASVRQFELITTSGVRIRGKPKYSITLSLTSGISLNKD